MANSYFNYRDPVSPGSSLNSRKYNGDFKAVERAFDSLPAPNDLVSSYKNYGVTAGTATAYTLNLTAFDTTFGYIEGMQVIAKIHITNAGPSTLSVSGLPAVPIVNLATGLGPLVAGDIRQNALYSFRFDGTNFQLTSCSSRVLEEMRTISQQATQSATVAVQAATTAGTLLTSALFDTAVLNATRAKALAPGVTRMFAVGVDPNMMFPGTLWTMLTGTSTQAKAWSRVS